MILLWRRGALSHKQAAVSTLTFQLPVQPSLPPSHTAHAQTKHLLHTQAALLPHGPSETAPPNKANSAAMSPNNQTRAVLYHLQAPKLQGDPWKVTLEHPSYSWNTTGIAAHHSRCQGGNSALSMHNWAQMHNSFSRLSTQTSRLGRHCKGKP